MGKSKKDAWQQYSEMVKGFTKEISPRPDLKVTARAHKRGVEFEIGKLREGNINPELGDLYKWIWTSSGIRNVNTMRELAQAITEACDFVDEMNPKWHANKIDWDSVDISVITNKEE